MSGPHLFQVFITDLAAADLQAISDYIENRFSREAAAKLVATFTERIGELATFPHRGSIPREAEALGLTEYRQIVVGPNRIFYRVDARRVDIFLVADGRRDMQALLRQRLLDWRGPQS